MRNRAAKINLQTPNRVTSLYLKPAKTLLHNTNYYSEFRTQKSFESHAIRIQNLENNPIRFKIHAKKNPRIIRAKFNKVFFPPWFSKLTILENSSVYHSFAPSIIFHSCEISRHSRVDFISEKVVIIFNMDSYLLVSFLLWIQSIFFLRCVCSWC